MPRTKTNDQAETVRTGDYSRWLEDQSAFLAELALGSAGPDATLVALAIRAAFGELACEMRSARFQIRVKQASE